MKNLDAYIFDVGCLAGFVGGFSAGGLVLLGFYGVVWVFSAGGGQ